MKQQNKFKQEQQQQHEQEIEQKAEQQQGRECSSAEELLRFDAGQTAVPAAVAQRLQKSSAEIPRPARSWWQRFFKG